MSFRSSRLVSFPSPSSSDDFDVFTSCFRFTLHVKRASMVCFSSGIQLEARTGLGFPQNSFREEKCRHCNIYRAASRPGTYSRMTFGIRGLFLTNTHEGRMPSPITQVTSS
uniref:Uncharacterized protein n=1 Tax=Arundo donax TaxID=35708 RepID=A0A0A9FGM3_ARUDO